VRTRNPPSTVVPTDEEFKTFVKKVPKPPKEEVIQKTRSRFQVYLKNLYGELVILTASFVVLLLRFCCNLLKIVFCQTLKKNLFSESSSVVSSTLDNAQCNSVGGCSPPIRKSAHRREDHHMRFVLVCDS
jgi:hypothetical protein